MKHKVQQTWIGKSLFYCDCPHSQRCRELPTALNDFCFHVVPCAPFWFPPQTPRQKIIHGRGIVPFSVMVSIEFKSINRTSEFFENSPFAGSWETIIQLGSSSRLSAHFKSQNTSIFLAKGTYLNVTYIYLKIVSIHLAKSLVFVNLSKSSQHLDRPPVSFLRGLPQLSCTCFEVQPS